MSTTLRDGVLAAVALVAYVGLLARVNARPAVVPVLAGALGAVLIEAVAGRFHGRVRAVWNRRSVRVLALAGVLLAGVAAVRLGAAAVLSAVAGGLAAYVALLALVGGGVLPPPRDWRLRS